VSRLVLVVPLKEGKHARARKILAEGPPFDLEEMGFERHQVFLTEREVVFVFEAAGPSATLHFSAEDPTLWKAGAAWRECIAERPRKAEVAYAWDRRADKEGLSHDATPGPGDSDGGDVDTP
jgi:hypothetical protein